MPRGFVPLPLRVAATEHSEQRRSPVEHVQLHTSAPGTLATQRLLQLMHLEEIVEHMPMKEGTVT